jgi:hypothetical protein
MSLPLPGAGANDLLNSQNNRMKSIALERPFLLTFWLQQKSKLNEGIRLKNVMDDSARSA